MKGDSMRHLLWMEKLPVFFAALLLMLCWPAQRASAAIIRTDENCSLHDAIVAANTDSPAGGCPAGAGADTIRLSDFGRPMKLAAELPPITSEITIEGNAKSLSARREHRHFLVAGGTLSLNQIKLVSGEAEKGGAIYVTAGGQLTVRNSQICYNFAEVGGGIAADGGSRVSIHESTLCRNQAQLAWGYGGGINVAGSSKLLITNSAFVDNFAYFEGGAIRSESSNMSVVDSTFSENRTREAGGAITASQGTTLSIESSAIVNNLTRARGAGISASESTVAISNSTISGNRATGDNVEFSSFGGGIASSRGKLALIHVTVVNNYANWAGGLSISSSESERISLINSILAGNLDADCHIGEQVTLSPNVGNLIQDGSCQATLYGDPGLHFLVGLRPHHPLEPSSRASMAGDPQHCLPYDQLGRQRQKASGCDIGAIESTLFPVAKNIPDECTLFEEIVAANRDAPYGACPAGSGADTITLTQDITLSQSLPVITSEITVQGRGHSISGANAFRILSVGRGGKLIVNSLRMIDGDAWEGGAISVHSGGELIVSNSVFSRNSAVAGGAIALLRGHATVASSRFLGNHAVEEGGAVWTYQDENLVHIEGSSFYGNTAGVSGGAFHSTLSNLKLVNTTVSGNSASQGGGMHFVYFTAEQPKRVNVRHVTIVGNQALSGDAIGGGARLELQNRIVMGSIDLPNCNPFRLTDANLIEDRRCAQDVINSDPMLGALDEEGGFRPLLPGSPAIDTADPRFCTETDQLGNPRPQGAGCDLGAIEFMGE